MRRTIVGEEVQFIVFGAILFAFLKPFCDFVCGKGHRQMVGDRYTRAEDSDRPNKKGARTIKSGMKEVVDENGKCKKGDHADSLWVGALPAWFGFQHMTLTTIRNVPSASWARKKRPIKQRCWIYTPVTEKASSAGVKQNQRNTYKDWKSESGNIDHPFPERPVDP